MQGAGCKVEVEPPGGLSPLEATIVGYRVRNRIQPVGGANAPLTDSLRWKRVAEGYPGKGGEEGCEYVSGRTGSGSAGTTAGGAQSAESGIRRGRRGPDCEIEAKGAILCIR